MRNTSRVSCDCKIYHFVARFDELAKFSIFFFQVGGSGLVCLADVIFGLKDACEG